MGFEQSIDLPAEKKKEKKLSPHIVNRLRDSQSQQPQHRQGDASFFACRTCFYILIMRYFTSYIETIDCLEKHHLATAPLSFDLTNLAIAL